MARPEILTAGIASRRLGTAPWDPSDKQLSLQEKNKVPLSGGGPKRTDYIKKFLAAHMDSILPHPAISCLFLKFCDPENPENHFNSRQLQNGKFSIHHGFIMSHRNFIRPPDTHSS